MAVPFDERPPNKQFVSKREERIKMKSSGPKNQSRSYLKAQELLKEFTNLVYSNTEAPWNNYLNELLAGNYTVKPGSISLPSGVTFSPPDKVYLKVGELLALLILEEIRFYPFNRGLKGGFSIKRAQKIAMEFDPTAFGEGIVSYSNRWKGFILYDSHTRMIALMWGALNGYLTPQILSSKVSVAFGCPNKGYETSRTKNNSKKHTQIEYLSNPETAFGAEIQRIVEGFDEQQKKVVAKQAHYGQLTNIIYGLYHEVEPHFSSFYAKRKQVVKMRDLPYDHPGAITLSGQQIAAIKSGIDFFLTYLDLCKDEIRDNQQLKVIRGGTWFGVLLVDHLRPKEDRLFSSKPKVLANRTAKRASDICNIVPQLTHVGKPKSEALLCELQKKLS